MPFFLSGHKREESVTSYDMTGSGSGQFFKSVVKTKIAATLSSPFSQYSLTMAGKIKFNKFHSHLTPANKISVCKSVRISVTVRKKVKGTCGQFVDRAKIKSIEVCLRLK